MTQFKDFSTRIHARYAVREAKLTEQLQSQSIEDIDAQIAALSK